VLDPVTQPLARKLVLRPRHRVQRLLDRPVPHRMHRARNPAGAPARSGRPLLLSPVEDAEVVRVPGVRCRVAAVGRSWSRP
jgi:hypothetical protein